MEKRIAILLYILLLMIGALANIYALQTKAEANEKIVIPNEAIRLRILANSDSAEDQALKQKVRDAVNEQINQWVADLTSFEQAKTVIQSRLGDIEETVEKVLKEEKSKQSFKVEFGSVNFPTKIYGHYIYPAGEYEAILITLGDGMGANWWCVLFPPLCFLDFSNGEAVRKEEKTMTASVGVSDVPAEKPQFVAEEEEEKVEVKFFVKELWETLFANF